MLSYGNSKEIWNLHPLPEFVNVTLSKEKPLESDLPQMQITDLSGTIFLNSFSKLSKITDLKILAKNLTEIEPEAICSNRVLRKFEIILGLSQLQVTKKLFKGCEDLLELSIVGNYEKTTSLDTNTFDNLSKLKNLNLVSLDIPHLTHSDFKNLKSLTYLSINKCKLKKIDSDVFDNLENLKELEIFFNELTTLPKNLFKKTPKLEKLLLMSNNITDLTWDEFEGLSKLTDLHIGRNNINFFDAEKIAKNMPNLKEFSFELNPVDCKKREAFANELKLKLSHPITISHKFDPGFADSCEDL